MMGWPGCLTLGQLWPGFRLVVFVDATGCSGVGAHWLPLLGFDGPL